MDEIRQLLAWRLSDEPAAPCAEGIVEGSDEDSEIRDPAERAKVKATIFLGCTSNLISAGTRETVCAAASGGRGDEPGLRRCTQHLHAPRPAQIRYLVQNKRVSCLVTTAGGIEEDLMKCLAPHYLGSTAGVEGFNLKGSELRKKGINRIGNLLVPNKNYCLFEDWLTPLLDTLLEEQKATGHVTSPSQVRAG